MLLLLAVLCSVYRLGFSRMKYAQTQTECSFAQFHRNRNSNDGKKKNVAFYFRDTRGSEKHMVRTFHMRHHVKTRRGAHFAMQ